MYAHIASRRFSRRKTRSDKGKKHKKPEAKLHEKIIADLESKQLTNYGPPNGAAQMAGNFAVGRAMSKRGAHAGMFDILVFSKGADGSVGLAIELKIGRNPLSAAQRLWQQKLQDEGWRCTVE